MATNPIDSDGFGDDYFAHAGSNTARVKRATAADNSQGPEEVIAMSFCNTWASVASTQAGHESARREAPRRRRPR